MTLFNRRLAWFFGVIVAAALLVVPADYAVAWKRSSDLCSALPPGTAEDKIRSVIEQPAPHVGLVAESKTTTFAKSDSATAITAQLEVTFQGFLFAKLSCTMSVKDGKVGNNGIRLPTASKQQIEIPVR